MRLSRTLGNDSVTTSECYNSSMIPARLNLVCPQGTTFKKKFTFFDNDNLPLDLTGYSSKMQVRKTLATKTAMAEFNTPDEITIVGNEIQIDVHYSVTELFKAGEFMWDLEITSPTDERSRVFEGKFIVTPEVTR